MGGPRTSANSISGMSIPHTTAASPESRATTRPSITIIQTLLARYREIIRALASTGQWTFLVWLRMVTRKRAGTSVAYSLRKSRSTTELCGISSFALLRCIQDTPKTKYTNHPCIVHTTPLNGWQRDRWNVTHEGMDIGRINHGLENSGI